MEKLQVFTFEELGITEDMYSNFLIDCWETEQIKIKNPIPCVITGIPVTVTITKDNYTT